MKIDTLGQPALQVLAQRLEGPTRRTMRALSCVVAVVAVVAGEPTGFGVHAAFGIPPSVAARAG